MSTSAAPSPGRGWPRVPPPGAVLRDALAASSTQAAAGENKVMWFPDITDVPKLGCFGLELKHPISAGFPGEAGGADGLYLPEKPAVHWKLHLHVGSGVHVSGAVLVCRERVRTRGVLLPGARAGGLRYAIIGFCIYETSGEAS